MRSKHNCGKKIHPQIVITFSEESWTESQVQQTTTGASFQ